MSRSFVRLEWRLCAATTEAPHRQKSRRGRIPKEPSDLYEGGSSDAPFPGEVQFFLDFIIAGFSPDELSNDPRLLPSTSQGRSFPPQSHSSVRPFVISRRGGAGAKRRKSLGFERHTRKRPGLSFPYSLLLREVISQSAAVETIRGELAIGCVSTRRNLVCGGRLRQK